VAHQSARALMDLAVAHRIALGNGILTVETEAQAWTRAKRSEGNAGGHAAAAALALARLARKV
jgi:6,7-dimethyl-8-ribityllumazine synthase